MYENICYEKSFLKQVIARVDFVTPLLPLEKAVPAKMLDALIEHFPIVEPPAEVSSHEVSIDANAVSTRRTTLRQWNYFTKDRSAQLMVAPVSLVAVYGTYQTYEETKAQFGAVIDALSKSFPDAKAARFGLRYVNQIDQIQLQDPTDWRTYIADSLLSVGQFFHGDSLTRAMSLVELKYDDVEVKFQFGMPNPDHPAEIKRPLFVLDLDGAVAHAHDLADVPGYMDAAHDRIQAIYERSITDALREEMHAKPFQQ